MIERERDRQREREQERKREKRRERVQRGTERNQGLRCCTLAVSACHRAVQRNAVLHRAAGRPRFTRQVSTAHFADPIRSGFFGKISPRITLRSAARNNDQREPSFSLFSSSSPLFSFYARPPRHIYANRFKSPSNEVRIICQWNCYAADPFDDNNTIPAGLILRRFYLSFPRRSRRRRRRRRILTRDLSRQTRDDRRDATTAFYLSLVGVLIATNGLSSRVPT